VAVSAARAVASVRHVTLTRLEQQTLAHQARTDRLVARPRARRHHEHHQQQQQLSDARRHGYNEAIADHHHLFSENKITQFTIKSTHSEGCQRSV